MNCIEPFIAYLTGYPTKTGKAEYYIDFERRSEKTKQGYFLFMGENSKIRFKHMPPYAIAKEEGWYLQHGIEIPCGNCLGCSIDKSIDWSTRLFEEAKLHKFYYFTTLTYNDKNYHENRNFKEDLQLFLKRFRKAIGQKIRYFATFEKGEHTQRGHFHIIIFFDEKPKDQYRFLKKNANNEYYSSEIIQKTWQHGYDVTVLSDKPEAALNYVSRYCVKKIGDAETFHMESRMPGIGENAKSIQKSQNNYILIHTEGKTTKRRIPKYVKDQIEKENENWKKENTEKNRRWILTNYLKPVENKNITDKEKLKEEKTKQLLLKYKTKTERRIK